MLLILALAGLIWFGLGYLNADRRLRISLLVVLFTGVLFFQLTLPEGNPLREATGGSFGNWLAAAVILAVVLLYRNVLARLRTRHEQADTSVAVEEGPFKDEELERYARHIVLRELGGAGQQKLKKARVLVVGAGGLGSPVLQYLAAAGVGTIGVIDDDTVELSNLQRQVLFSDNQIGMPKVFAAAEKLKAQNPFVEILPYNRRLTVENAAELIAEYDVVVDGSDTSETRYLVNDAAIETAKPLVSGAITQWEGQVSVFNLGSDGPCYACAFPNAPADGLAPSCAEAGVVGALPGVVGSLMALEVIKVVSGAGEILSGKLLVFDGLYGETRTIAVDKVPTCKKCS